LNSVFCAIRRRLITALALVLSATLLVGLLTLVRSTARPSRVEQLKAAIGRCDASGSETLLNAGVNPSAPLYVSFLDLAIRCDDPKLVALLLRHGADPNQQSMGGLPLEAAAARGQIESMKLLLDAGADATRVGEGGGAITSAVAECQTEAATLLLNKGAPRPSIAGFRTRHIESASRACAKCPALMATMTEVRCDDRTTRSR
jgi:hypothetical protein